MFLAENLLEEDPMKKIATVMVAVFAMVFAASCAKKATPEEAKKACQNMMTLEKAAKPQPAPTNAIQAVEADFRKKLQELQTAQAQAMQAIDAELQTKMGELKDDAAKEALKKTYDEMKNTKAQEMAPQFQEMQKAKADALKAAQEAQAKADAELKAKEEAALKACVDKATKDRMGKAKADCQIAAKKFEDFQKCK